MTCSVQTEFSDAPPNPEAAMYGKIEEDSSRIWVGKDYTNFIAKDFVDLDHPFTGK